MGTWANGLIERLTSYTDIDEARAAAERLGVDGHLMSQANVVVTRMEYAGPPRRSRNFEGRLIVRFPSLYRRMAVLVLGLSPRSRVRRAFLCREGVSGLAAYARRDFKLMLVRYAPDVEVENAPGFKTLDLGGTFQGHAGLVEAYERFAEAWGSSEVEPAYVLDLGDRGLALGFFRTHARASGVQLEEQFAQLLTPGDDGLVAREEIFFSWEGGMRAAGLDPDAIALPSRESTAQTRGLEE